MRRRSFELVDVVGFLRCFLGFRRPPIKLLGSLALSFPFLFFAGDQENDHDSGNGRHNNRSGDAPEKRKSQFGHLLIVGAQWSICLFPSIDLPTNGASHYDPCETSGNHAAGNYEASDKILGLVHGQTDVLTACLRLDLDGKRETPTGQAGGIFGGTKAGPNRIRDKGVP